VQALDNHEADWHDSFEAAALASVCRWKGKPPRTFPETRFF
jgi:hypothetical protein